MFSPVSVDVFVGWFIAVPWNNTFVDKGTFFPRTFLEHCNIGIH